jgi:hypothetical protein
MIRHSMSYFPICTQASSQAPRHLHTTVVEELQAVINGVLGASVPIDQVSHRAYAGWDLFTDMNTGAKAQYILDAAFQSQWGCVQWECILQLCWCSH